MGGIGVSRLAPLAGSLKGQRGKWRATQDSYRGKLDSPLKLSVLGNAGLGGDGVAGRVKRVRGTHSQFKGTLHHALAPFKQSNDVAF